MAVMSSGFDRSSSVIAPMMASQRFIRFSASKSASSDIFPAAPA